MNFGTVSTGGGAFGVSRESKEGYQCWLKITVNMFGNSSAHAPGGGSTPPTTEMTIVNATIKSECVCEEGIDHGATHDYPGPDFGTGGGPGFGYKWSIWYGPKCGGRFCWPEPWQADDPDGDDSACPCVGGCGPFSLSIDDPIKSSSRVEGKDGMRRALAKEAKDQMMAAQVKQPCIMHEGCE